MALKQEEEQERISSQLTIKRNEDGSYLIRLSVNPDKLKGGEALEITLNEATVGKLVRKAQGINVIGSLTGEKLVEQALSEYVRGLGPKLKEGIRKSLSPHNQELAARFDEAIQKITKEELARADAPLTSTGKEFSYNSRTNTLTFQIPDKLAHLGICAEYVKQNGKQVSIDTSPPFVAQHIKNDTQEHAVEYVSMLIAKRLSGTQFPSESLTAKVKAALMEPIKEAVLAVSKDLD